LILVGLATCGLAAAGNATLQVIKETLAKHKIDATVMPVGAWGCATWKPLVDIIKPGRPRISYSHMTKDKVAQIIEDYLVNDNPRPDLALGTMGEGTVEGIPRFFELPMLKPQVRIILDSAAL